MSSEVNLLDRPTSLKFPCVPRKMSESLQTADGSSQPDTFNITFCKLVHTVRTWSGDGLQYKRDKKRILDGVSGVFQSGELTGLIGPSGCGKSTLMDILTGYTRSQYGEITVKDGEGKDVVKQCSYIMQDDKLEPLLTVSEAINFAAHLKFGSRISNEKKVQKVDDVLKSLKLSADKNKRIEMLSGGGKKRLAIALELLTNPPIMFFDEPTSGLDYSSSKQCLMILKDLAVKEGRIVVCSIHQPSASLFEMFDHLYVMASGKCAYQGSVKPGLLKFLSSLNLICPTYHNIADYVIELSVGEHGKHVLDTLVNASGNGTCHDWRKNQRKQVLPSHNPSTCSTPISVPDCQPSVKPVIVVVQSNVDKESCRYRKIRAASFFTQFSVLLQRTLRKFLREKFMSQARYILHVIIGMIIGTFYYGIGNNAAHVFDNFSLLFFCLMFLMFTSYSAMILAYPSELPIVTREYFNSWYSLKSYYLAITVADTPFQVLCSTSYCLVVYFMSSQPLEIDRFCMFALICALVSLVSQTMGLLIGIALKIEYGVLFGSLAMMPWVIFSGFFLKLTDAPPYLQWLFHISFLKYGLEGVMVAIYGYDRPRMPCSDDYCHFIIPSKLLKELNMLHSSYWVSFAVLFGLFAVLRLITFYMLKYQVNHRR